MPEPSLIVLVVDSGLLVLIWMVQAVVYPGFRHVETASFKAYHRAYTRKMAWIAAPLMIAQLAASGWALATDFQSLPAIRHFTLVVSSWLVTFAVSVRLHNQLQSRGKDPATINSLVSTNWIRTALWTGTFALSLWNCLPR